MIQAETMAATGRPVPAQAARGRRVTDAPTRMFHWLFALSFAGGWLTGDSEHWRALHVTLGYTMAALLGFRVVYGLIGPRHARLSLLWRKLAGAPAWLRALRNDGTFMHINWRLGHNLLMAAAVALMLLTVVPLALSGYATYSDWGGEWLEEVHEFFANACLAIVTVHLALMALSSVLRRQNQALPMLTGRIPGTGPDLVRKNRRWLAALLLLGVLGLGAWQWQLSPHGLLPGSARHAEQSHDGDD